MLAICLTNIASPAAVYSMGEFIRGSLSYVLLSILAMGLVMIWPDIALWLP